jgi:bifunctional pyridoxal-dependent enzyme with beta-cystathionase and maltose regulon repressor activities
MPGSSFGAAGAGHIRLSLTTPQSDLQDAIDGIVHLAEQRRAFA